MMIAIPLKLITTFPENGDDDCHPIKFDCNIFPKHGDDDCHPIEIDYNISRKW